MERSEYLRWLNRLGLRLPTLEKHRACLYLERHGFRFLVDFGFDNAPDLARQHRGKCAERAK